MTNAARGARASRGLMVAQHGAAGPAFGVTLLLLRSFATVTE
jgi:hypothetical protein